MTKDELRAAFIESLDTQGFSVNGRIMPLPNSKSRFKKIQAHSKIEQFKLQKDFLNSTTEVIESFVRDAKEYKLNRLSINWLILGISIMSRRGVERSGVGLVLGGCDRCCRWFMYLFIS